MKDGIKSTEFWLTLVAVIGSILVASGILGDTEATYLQGLVKEIISGAVALVTLVTYILSRASIKREGLKAAAKIEEAKIVNAVSAKEEVSVG